jgi:hypothetical protein
MMKFIVIALIMVCTGCASFVETSRAFARAIPLCELILNEQTYAGMRVEARGLLINAPHGRDLYDPKCDRTASVLGGAGWGRRGRAADLALERGGGVRLPVAVSGILQPHVKYENGEMIIHPGSPSLKEALIVASGRPYMAGAREGRLAHPTAQKVW